MERFSLRTAGDGARIVASNEPLAAYPLRVGDDLVAWAARRPDATFLADRGAAGLRRLTYGDALARVRSIGAGLLASGASVDEPLGIIAENGIDHALFALAAMYVGIPVSPISVGYAAPDASPARLRDILETLGATTFFAGSPEIAQRISAVRESARVETDLSAFAGGTLADDAFARVDGDTIAKIMFTSGSTGTPKGAS